MATEANFSCFDSNLSREFLTEEVWSLNPVVQSDTPTRYTLAAIVILLLLLGLPSNILVITVVLRKKLYQHQPTIVLLLNLAVTDLLVCVLVMPWNIVTLIAGEFQFGGDDHTRCQVCQTGVIFVILSLVTLNNLAVISVDRLVYFRAAIHYSKLVTNTRVLIATILVWLLSIVITIPPLFGFNEMRFSTAVGICTIAFSGSTYLAKNSYYLILLAVAVLVPIAILVVTNAWGMCIIQNQLRKKSKNLKKDKQNHRKSFHKKLKRQQQTGQVKLVKIYGAIFITNLITYIPIVARLITGVVAEADEFTQAVRISGTLAYIALLSQSVVHPIVQASLIGDVRKGIAAQLNTLAKKISRSELSQSNIEDSYNARKTSEDSYNARKISRQSNIEDSYNVRKTSSNEFCQSNARKTSMSEFGQSNAEGSHSERKAAVNGCTMSLVCTNLDLGPPANGCSFVVATWGEGKNPGNNNTPDLGSPANGCSLVVATWGEGNNPGNNNTPVLGIALPGSNHHLERSSSKGSDSDNSDIATQCSLQIDEQNGSGSVHLDTALPAGGCKGSGTEGTDNLDVVPPVNE